MKDMTALREHKYAFARLNGRLEKFINEFESVKCDSNLSIDVGADKIYGMKKVTCAVDPNSVQKEINDFFREFSKYRVHDDLLQLFNDFVRKIDQKYAKIFRDFKPIDWTDKESFEPYCNMLQAWLKEDESRRKAAKDHKGDSKKQQLPPPRNKTPLEVQFEELVMIIYEDRKYIADSLDALHHYIKGNKELSARFGEVPNFKEEKSLQQWITGSSSNKDMHSFIEPTMSVLRFYWLSYQILTYLRHLYNCNELFAIEMGKLKQEGVYMDDGSHPNFDHFISRVQEQPLDIANEACQLYMEKYEMSCASVRYLIAHTYDVNYQSYIESGYHELSKTENLNSLAKKVDLLCIHADQVYGIVVDEEYRSLVQAQSEMTRKYSTELQAELASESKRDYRQSNAQQEFVSFYEKPFRNTIIQWIEGYLALTNDQRLLQHLNHRFSFDGCHLTPFELQFILLSSANLQTNNRCDIEFLLLLCSSVPQGELVNVCLYMQIVYYRGQRFYDTKIYYGIQLIESARHKALFAIKLNEHDQSIDADQIYKLILMLQHSSGGSEQLENMTLREWIDIANKQKWSEVGALIKKYGEVGYYLGYLDDRERQKEERMMRDVFDSVQYIPEILIAKISQFIANAEVNANEDYFKKLRSILESGNDFPDLEANSEKRPYLITREFEQQKFIKYIKEKNPDKYEALLPSKKRKIDDMINLVTGLHDRTEEAKLARKDEIKRIGDMVKVFKSHLSLIAESFSLLVFRKCHQRRQKPFRKHAFALGIR
jgi:hypothetical protein